MDDYVNIHRKKTPGSPKQRCNRCRGSGMAPCQVCGGSGRVLTGMDANGHPAFAKCAGCFGLKKKRCNACNGQGFR